MRRANTEPSVARHGSPESARSASSIRVRASSGRCGATLADSSSANRPRPWTVPKRGASSGRSCTTPVASRRLARASCQRSGSCDQHNCDQGVSSATAKPEVTAQGQPRWSNAWSRPGASTGIPGDAQSATDCATRTANRRRWSLAYRPVTVPPSLPGAIRAGETIPPPSPPLSPGRRDTG
jgi:hypothetical protein